MKKLEEKRQKRQKEKERALYVRLPHTIKKEEDVAKFFTGNFKVNLLRQSSRYCYVIFSDVKEKMKNLKAAKGIQVNGKRLVVAPAVTKVETKPINRKKIVPGKIKEDVKVTKNIFVSNIKCGTKIQDLRAAIPGCLSIKMLKPYSENSRAAIVRMESGQLAAQYLLRSVELPVVGERQLRMNPDTRERIRSRNKSKPFKIYDGDGRPCTKEIFSKRGNEALDHIVLENNM
ncbi:hypothetical protein WH47_06740 [Habropoda laboriosa]|uniref:RRM domain-containing protein n=2 Tax=Habropoda laboriosa TaxID=597456 RepID=A0A0L7RIK8_9HYME|nr:hypothetical protein WH47_06740 [Habropoda laboriosa]